MKKRWIIIILIVAAIGIVGSIALSSMWHECIVCEKHGFYKGVEIEGEHYYACPEHEEALERVAYAYTAGKKWAESFYGAFSEEVETMYGSFVDTLDRIMRFEGGQP